MTAEHMAAMQADKVTRKVILLAICEKLDSLTRQELMETALESMYMDYFQFVELLDELLQEQLVSATQRKHEVRLDAAGRVPERFSLTEKGLRVLNTLRDKIPSPVSAYVHRSLNERESVLKNEGSVHQSKRLLEDGSYEVQLELYERGNRYFACQVHVPNEAMAASCCERWSREAGSLYPEILKILFRQAESPAKKTAEPPADTPAAPGNSASGEASAEVPEDKS